MKIDLDQYRCQPEKRTYCPHMDQAHSLLAEWLTAWDGASDTSSTLHARTRALLARHEGLETGQQENLDGATVTVSGDA